MIFNYSVIAFRILKTRVFWLLVFSVLIGIYLFFIEYKNIQSETMLSWQQTFNADCGVVLTGGPGRIREGFALLQNHQIKKLIISGVNERSQLKDIYPNWFAKEGWNENDVILEKKSGTTFGNAQQSLALVEALRCRDIILITSRVHMYRAYKTFRVSYPKEIEIYKQSVQQGGSDSNWAELLSEILKILFYSLWAY